MLKQKSSGRKKGSKKTNKISSQQQPLKQQISQHFTRFLNAQRIALFKQKLSNFYGKNFVIDYQERFNFQEEWQDRGGSLQKQCGQDILEQSKGQIGWALFKVTIFTLGIWISGVDLVFRESNCHKNHPSDRNIYNIIYSLSNTVILLDWLFNCSKLKRQKSTDYALLTIFKRNYQYIFCLLTCTFKIIGGTPRQHQIWVGIQFFSLCFMYGRVSRIYQSLRLTSYSLYYQYHSKILDLIITLFSILHGTAMLLFVSTFLGYETTWMSNLDLEGQNQFIHYLYSFYYGSTTILTVGYGDISPKNPVEIAVIVFVQILGIGTHGFIVSQINYCISNLKKSRYTMEKDLSIIMKMKNHYHMSEKVTAEARSFVINNKRQANQLYPKEEHYLLQKFNEELRNTMATQNSLSIVKSSLFFITRWSLNFQKAIATKIEHVLFSANDTLYQPKNNERIYIIKSGRINVYAEKKGRKKGQKNLLKTIDNNASKQVSDNCYGYTAVISTRPSRLYAIATNLTSAYYVQKDHFLQCLSQRISDHEYYHQIKSKIDQANHREAFQAPRLQSCKSHYDPTKRYVINSHLHSGQNNKTENLYKRNRSRAKLQVSSSQFEALLIRCKLGRGDSKNISSYPQIHHQSSSLVNARLPQGSEQLSYEDSQQTTLKVTTIKQILTNVNIKNHLDHYFQASKQYSNYFPKQNRSAIIAKYQLDFVLPKRTSAEETDLMHQTYLSVVNSSHHRKN